MLASYSRIMREARARRWGWCLNGNHSSCRGQQEAGDGTVEQCGCACHTRAREDETL